MEVWRFYNGGGVDIVVVLVDVYIEGRVISGVGQALGEV